ncbi:15092_t:CDS:2 [Acaulospora colombiana]|uniref:15092_t:CDS:1 n=1 Tax=Acaulospora colombiana TaxID=27376 RepID=A0ACA9KRM3_9GLOM|nr:15092_t:CDS:2 [Acaulospora colombiana]
MPARRTVNSSGASAYNTPSSSQQSSTKNKRSPQKNGISDSDGGGSSGNSPKYTAYVRERSYDDLNDNPFAREEAFLRAMSESDTWASTFVPQSSIDSIYSVGKNDIEPSALNFSGDNTIGSRDIHNSAPISSVTATATATTASRRNGLLWLFVILLTTLFMLSLFESPLIEKYIPSFPSPIKIQLWPVNNATYLIQNMGERDDNGGITKDGKGDNDEILLTMDDLKKLIAAEVRNSCVGKGVNAPAIGPNPDHVRDLISKEVRSFYRSDAQRIRGNKYYNLDAIMDLVRKEISKELLVFSQDTLKLPDFALHSGGARIISAFTSETYEVWPEKWYSKIFAHVSGQGILRGKPPVTAISPETYVGQCWPFPGQKGQLAILLNRRVYVNAVTYDHVSKDVAIEVMSAPKEFEVWGIVDDGKSERGKPTASNELDEVEDEIFMESTEEECGIREDGQYISDCDNNANTAQNANSKALSDLDPSLGSTPLYFHLGTFIYDINGLPVQTFNVSQEVLKNNKPLFERS